MTKYRGAVSALAVAVPLLISANYAVAQSLERLLREQTVNRAEPRPEPKAEPERPKKAAPRPQPKAQQPTIVTQSTSVEVVVVDGLSPNEMNRKIANLAAQIRNLELILDEQRKYRDSLSPDDRHAAEKTVSSVILRVEELKRIYLASEKSFGTYLTSVRPTDKDIYMTARKASELYPRIPYYIAGTRETGEFWVDPTITDTGSLQFSFNFVDTQASVEKIRGTILLDIEEASALQKALLKLFQWSKVAHEQKLRRNYEKRVVCFPESNCPIDDQRVDGKASTELRFVVYEDGSTSGRIQRNKGRFAEGYNISVESALLLQAYLKHVIDEAKMELRQGSQDKKSLDEMFK